MKKMMMVAALAAVAMFGGCRTVKVENHGEDFLKDANGAPILYDGKPVKCSKGWSVVQKSHWMKSEADELSAGISSADGSKIDFHANGLKSDASEEFNKSMNTFMMGAAAMMRLAAACCSPGAASIPLTPEAADPAAVAKLVDARASAKVSEIKAKSERETARINAQSNAEVNKLNANAAADIAVKQGNADALCTGDACKAK